MSDPLESNLFRKFVVETAREFSKLRLPASRKKSAMVNAVAIYEPSTKDIAVTVEDGQIVYVSVSHPRLGFVEVTVPHLVPAA